jgi:hypothetical protein
MTLRSVFVAFALIAAPVAVAVAPAAVAQSASGALTGDWTGGYLSSDGNDVNTFDVTFDQRGARLNGTVVEVNAIGDVSKVLFLTSTLTGSVNGDQVVFTKTYDGSGGVSHSVIYRGVLEPNGRRIRGSYDASGATGSFEMVR